MKIVKFLQKNKNLDINELKERLLDISKVELVEMLIETIQNIPTPEQTIKPEPIKVSAEVYNTLTKLIENNFVVVGADGRCRKSLIQEMLDTLGYADAVKKIIEEEGMINSIKNIKLKNLYILEKLRREENSEDITDFQPTQLNRGLIKNKPY